MKLRLHRWVVVQWGRAWLDAESQVANELVVSRHFTYAAAERAATRYPHTTTYGYYPLLARSGDAR